MKRVGIIAKPQRPEVVELLGQFIPWLREQGLEVFLDEDSAPSLRMEGYPRARIPALAEMLVVLGGDGTILSAARLVCEAGVPLLGVNLGGLGFIAEVCAEDIYPAMERVLKGDCPVEERMMLEVGIHRHGQQIASYTVLNDVVLNKGALARIIDIETSVDGSYMTTFRADGLIAATPTGSTAYSLSAGGPVLHPAVQGMVLTPICSHTLAIRPIVLPPSSVVEIRPMNPHGGEVFLTMDGQVGFSLMEKDRVVVRRSEHTTRLLVPFQRDFFKVLREKLKWGHR
jgi:NAD+ kinase